MKYEEKTIDKKEIYKGGIIDVGVITVKLPDGREATRDIVFHPGASVVIPINEDGEIYMVRQYRKAVERVLLELPAGKLDEGESPEVCAKRELKEETGLEAGFLKHIISIHSTPGFCNEILHMFLASQLTQGKVCADKDEFITVEKYPAKTLVNMIFNHEITDAKSIIGILIADRILKGDILL